jgi:serine/threonine-protein kinase
MPDPFIDGSSRRDDVGEPRSGTPAGRVRVELVPWSGSLGEGDVYRLLRRRLRVVCTMLAGFFVVMVGLSLFFSLTNFHPDLHVADLNEWVGRFWKLVLLTIAVSVTAVLLWRSPPQAVGGLRIIECVVIGALAIYMLQVNTIPFAWDFLVEAGRQETARGRLAYRFCYTLMVSLQWFFILTLYGTFIPNTWQRCAAVVAVLAACPVVTFMVQGLWLRPLDPTVFRISLLQIGFFVGLGAVIAVVSCSRIAILHRQAGEARRLGQYVLKEKLGEGGMGEVYLAQHVLLRRPCALKVIRPARAGDPKHLLRFEREVQATATLTHPNTVQVFDYGHTEDGTFYYVMEYLPGSTLEALVQQAGPLPPARAVHFLRQVCGALEEAHARGLTHRDIKPGNVMICERGGVPDVAKLLDFGLVLSPVNEAGGEKLTQDGMVTGTPAYLSPEQADGRDDVDVRSDIYSLGAVAYFLLTGQPPFAGRSVMNTLAAHLYEKPEPFSVRRPDVPADLEAVVLRCLAKEPQARFPDVKSLDRALAASLMGIEAGCDVQAGQAKRRT